MQVWYSAGWRSGTLDAFNKSVAAVLQRVEGQEQQTADVKEWLQAWAGRTVPLSKARAAWIDRRKQSLAGIGNLLRKDDRMAACYYAVSGDVEPPAGRNTSKSASSSDVDPAYRVSTGSVLMFAGRKSLYKRSEYAINEEFLTTLPAAALVEERLQGRNPFIAGTVVPASHTLHLTGVSLVLYLFVAAGTLLVKRRVAALATAPPGGSPGEVHERV